MYLQSGGVKLTVLNNVCNEAVVAILGPGDFFDEGSLAGQSVRMGTATAITPATVLAIEKSEMLKVLHAEHALSDLFIKLMLARNVRIEPDLVGLYIPDSVPNGTEWPPFRCHHGSMRHKKTKKVSLDATRASVKKEMARPRMAKSARMAQRRLDVTRISQRPTIGLMPE